MKYLTIALVYLAIAGNPAWSADDPAKQLAEIEKQLVEQPDSTDLHFSKTKLLMLLGRHDEGYAAAQRAMAAFIKAEKRLAWIILERIDAGTVNVDVHFNMGPRERRPPDMGIIRPLSFRVWSKGDEPGIVEIIDFEIGMMGGKPSTAALGKMEGRVHLNFGILDTDSTYPAIRTKLLDLVKQRHPPAEEKPEGKEQVP